MLKQYLIAVLLCSVAGHAMAASVSLRGTAGNASAALTWTIANGTINAQEVYRDTDSDPNGRVRIASLATSARSSRPG